MPRAHSCRDLPDELQAWAKTVASLVTDMLWPAPETGGPRVPPAVPDGNPVGARGILVGSGGSLAGSGAGSGDEGAVAGAVGCANDEPAVADGTEGAWVPWVTEGTWVPWVMAVVTVAGSTTRPKP
jgi:hypothetical protein